MVSEEPKVSDEGRYTTKEACALMGICPNTLRKWAKMGIVRKYRRKVSNKPFYKGRELKRVWMQTI